jgi:hypothetical protein
MLLLSQPSARLPSPVCSPNDPCRRLPASAPETEARGAPQPPQQHATAVSGSAVNRVANVARSESRRASRSLTFVFSALIWSNIIGIVVGMVTFSGFRSIGMIDLGGVYYHNAGSSTAECFVGSAQNLVGPDEARSVEYAGVGKP